MPWTAPWLCVPLAAALAKAGHEVEVVADGLESGVAQAAGVHIRVLSPMSTPLGTSPTRFLAQLAPLVGQREVISLTGRLAAPRWLPLDEPPGSMAARLCRERSALSAALECIHHPHLLAEGLAWRRAARLASRRGWSSQSLGDPSRGGLGAVSRIDNGLRTTPRDAARSCLAIDGRRAILVSAADDSVARLGPVFRGLARLGANAPQLLILGHRAASISRLAHAEGVAAHVRTLGLTKAPARVFEAADAALGLPRCGHSSGGGGFIADALACGLPVAADPDASGSWMLGESDIVKNGDWSKAIAGLLSKPDRPRPPRVWLTIDDLATTLLDLHLCSVKRA